MPNNRVRRSVSLDGKVAERIPEDVNFSELVGEWVRSRFVEGNDYPVSDATVKDMYELAEQVRSDGDEFRERQYQLADRIERIAELIDSERPIPEADESVAGKSLSELQDIWTDRDGVVTVDLSPDNPAVELQAEKRGETADELIRKFSEYHGGLYA